MAPSLSLSLPLIRLSIKLKAMGGEVTNLFYAARSILDYIALRPEWYSWPVRYDFNILRSVGIQVEKSPRPYAVRRDKRRHWIERIIESSAGPAIIEIFPFPSNISQRRGQVYYRVGNRYFAEESLSSSRIGCYLSSLENKNFNDNECILILDDCEEANHVKFRFA